MGQGSVGDGHAVAVDVGRWVFGEALVFRLKTDVERFEGVIFGAVGGLGRRKAPGVGLTGEGLGEGCAADCGCEQERVELHVAC